MHKKSKFTSYSLFASCVAAIGGILFGYNTSVISGVLLFISHDFGLSTIEQELIVSTLLIGALIGAFFGGFIADSFGRKKTLFFTLVLFFIGVLTLTEASGFHMLLWGRFISGLAIGIVSMAVPLYIAEMSPPENRGALVSINQLCITLGILIAYLVTYGYSESGQWRDMFGFAFIPIGLQFVGLFLIPETPSWLISHDKKERAEKILSKIRISHEGEDLAKIERSEDEPTKKNWRELFNPHVRMPFFIGIGVAVFQSITGINTVIYYAPQIFQLAGFEAAKTALFATVLLGIVNVLITIVALWLIDRLGRRPLLIGGLLGMGTSLVVLGFTFLSKSEAAGFTAVGALMAYIAFFAVSLGPVAWLIISEIYPLGIRGRAMGIATFTNWVSNYFVSLTFLTLIGVLGSPGTFWLYAFICICGLFFVIRFVPETKGKTFEQIQSFWKKP
ncbi:MAG: MFS transporter [Chlamydiae bacterium CG10_big_fil_rev_8_21_14_0_10_42_34]|nr:MAG: MFS transporter [Chlamydiae bacterium CG10_big_fil_rev_8_21_14_0_10_42_34]